MAFPKTRIKTFFRFAPLAVAPLLLAACAKKPEPAAKTAKPGDELPVVKSVAVRLGTLTQKLEVTGALKSDQNIALGSKLIGRVAKVWVREGAQVKRGQLLVTLDDDDLRAQLSGAQANLRSAQVRLLQTKTGLPARIAQVGTSIQQAQAAAAAAQARFQQALGNEPLRVRNVESAIVQAEAALSQAKSRLTQAQLGEPARVAAAQAQVNNAKEVVKTAQARLEQSRKTADQTEQGVEAEAKRADAALAASKAMLAEVQRGARDQQIASAKAQVNLAEAQLRDAETEMTRAKILFDGGAAPKQNLDSAQTRRDVAKAQLDAAQQNLSLVKEGATTEQVRQAQEAVRQAEAGVSQAQSARLRVPVAQGEITAALAALQTSQENQRSAEANLAQIGISREDTRAAEQAVAQAQSMSDNALEQRRQIPITKDETRVARETWTQALAAWRQAMVNRSQVPLARQDVLAAQASVQMAQAQLQQAQVNLQNARIASPVNGVVSQKLVEAGQSVSPAQPLLNVIALDEVYFEAQVSETEFARLRKGQAATVYVPAVSTQPLNATVTDVIPAADPRSRQFRVRISIPRSPRDLPVGAFARGTVTTNIFSNTLIVPSESIRANDDGSTSVFVVNQTGTNAKLKSAKVAAGVAIGTETQLLGGVQPGQRVVTGNPPVGDGSVVKLEKK